MKNTKRFREFIQHFTRLVEAAENDERQIFVDGKKLLTELIVHDDWLPDEFAKADDTRYQQYLLHCDPLERFSVVSFVWAPRQSTPIHDHTVWGMVGVMRGAEVCEEYKQGKSPDDLSADAQHTINVGEVDLVSPTIGDVHRVSNALADETSVSIHVYGANIGAVKRHTYDDTTGEAKQFISGYTGTVIPNIWDASLE